MEQREIPKNSKPPELSKEVITLLTKLCFRQNDNVGKVDLIFVLGSTDFTQTRNIVKSLLNKNISNSVLISGGIPKYEDSIQLPKSEAEIILEYIQPQEFPNVNFILEKESHNFKENVINGLKLFNKPIQSLCFVNRSQGAERCYLTLRKYLPEAKILQQVFESDYNGIKVGRSNWFKTEFGRERVWGEFLRIKKYGEMGNIEFDEVKQSVKEIIDKSKIK
jgi:hypothetical protein